MMQESESALNTDIARNTARKKIIVIQPFTKHIILCTFLRYSFYLFSFRKLF